VRSGRDGTGCAPLPAEALAEALAEPPRAEALAEALAAAPPVVGKPALGVAEVDAGATPAPLPWPAIVEAQAASETTAAAAPITYRTAIVQPL
jgi:hypothetical protein